MGDIFKRLVNLAKSEISHLKEPDRELNREFLDYLRGRPEYDHYRQAYEEEYQQQSGGQNHSSRQQQYSNASGQSLDYDPYKALEISPGASWDEIEKAFKKMARKYHPDRFQSEKEQELANKLMSMINASYSFLKQKHGKR